MKTIDDLFNDSINQITVITARLQVDEEVDRDEILKRAFVLNGIMREIYETLPPAFKKLEVSPKRTLEAFGGISTNVLCDLKDKAIPREEAREIWSPSDYICQACSQCQICY